jgi:hypothetical protein
LTDRGAIDTLAPVPCERSPVPKKARAAGWIALLSVLALAIPTILHLTRASTFRTVAPRAPAIPALTRHVLVIVIDGLRYDFATDEMRAPHLARNMREHSSAEVWAGRITMTSAAALSFGTGTRGNFSQILLNVHARRTAANHLFENAKRQGLSTGLIGDPVWKQAYGSFDRERLSPGDLALDIDDSAELLADAQHWVDAGAIPNLWVLHFFAHDHLGHSFGIFSPRFREYLLRFDANLQHFLDGLPKDVTVIVLSDHGALANGNHGVDSDLERRTPLFAYGPGIRPGQRLVLEQVDVAPTLATLLGIGSPAHGVGVPVTALLDLSADASAKLACAEAERLEALAQADNVALEGRSRACDPAGSPEDRLATARAMARNWDHEMEQASVRRGLRGLLQSMVVLIVFGAIVPVVLGLTGRRALVSALTFGLCAGCMVGLTGVVDRTLPPWNDTRALVAWLATALLAGVLFLPRVAERLYARSPFVVLALAPGLLFVSFPTNTQLHAALVVAVCLAAAALAARRAGKSAAPAALAVLGVLVALRVGAVREDPLGTLMPGREMWLGVGCTALWLCTAAGLETSRSRWLELSVGALVIGLAFALTRLLPATLGLSLLALLPLAAFASAHQRRPVLARALLFSTYALVSRWVEVPAVAGMALVGEGIGVCLCRASGPGAPSAPRWTWMIVLAASAVFALGFVARVGVQRGLDFGTMDFAAGTFDSKVVAPSRIGVALAVKYFAAVVLVSAAVLRWLPLAVVRSALHLLALALVLRLATMAAILYAPPVSFWSRFRMVGELGPVTLMAVAAVIAVIVLERRTELVMGSSSP